MESITSRQNRFVRACRDLAARPDPDGARVLLDGVHLIRDAHAAGCEFEFVGITSSRLDAHTEERDLAEQLESAGAPVFDVTDSAFSALSPVRTPSGMVAIALRTPTDASSIAQHPGGLVLVVMDIQDPGNLGAVIRVAEAGGASGVLVAGASAHPFSWKALRGGMGSTLRLPVACVSDAESCLQELRRAGFRTVAAIPAGGREPDAIEWTGPVALVLGGEGAGLPDAVTLACNEHVTIPMATSVESLNVAVAAGIVVYAARRQRVAGDAGRRSPDSSHTRETHRGYK
ncbi:MAG: RNA methyltransferase [Acidobacteria bacterium]|nr:RNA methyltransferase [Acidobacteriota bacterium]